MQLGLEGRAAIVTGASRGIGRAVAIALAAEGADLILCARGETGLADVAAEIRGGGHTAVEVAVDVTGARTADAVVDRCLAEYGRIDVLVNNAGGGHPKALDELTDDDWRAAWELNFLAAARLSLACVPIMRDAGWGRIVQIASISGREPDPWFAPYAAAKAALINFSTALSKAFASYGILSNCVVPGVTLTELVEANAAATGKQTGVAAEEVMARTLRHQGVAAGRFGQPAEIAAAVVFLASEQASWVAGATLEVDGGTLRSS